MDPIVITPDLVGASVRNAARPDWGAGRVLRIEATRVDGAPAHRVQVQFPTGSRALLVPPARLIAPTPEPQRTGGWLDQLGKNTLDDRLRRLPETCADAFGARARLAGVLPLFALGDDPAALLGWARSQTGVADPLSHWSRDELTSAFADFCLARDAFFRNEAARLQKAEGAEALQGEIARIPADLRRSIRESLDRLFRV